MPAIAGTSRLRSCWFPCRITPPPTRNSSGSTKLKKAALGLRQNIRRSRRYCRQVRASALGIGGQLQVDVLERRSAHAQLLQPLTASQRRGGELVQQARGVFGLALDELAVAIAVGDAVVRASHPQLARR